MTQKYSARARKSTARFAMHGKGTGTIDHPASASEALCCDYDGIALEDGEDSTYVIKGGYGERVVCPKGSAVTSICGSGSKLDCGGYATNAVCTYLE